MVNTESFKPVDSKYGTQYEVSDRGRLRVTNKSGSKIRTGSLHPQMHTTYIKASLSNEGVNYTVHMHRLVAAAFIPNPDNKPFVNHLDKDGTNNSVSNLEWSTHAENMQHSADNQDLNIRAQSIKKKNKSTMTNSFESYMAHIGKDIGGRTIIGVQYKQLIIGGKPKFKWFGVYTCNNCADEISSPWHQTMARSLEGRVQYCLQCSRKLTKQAEDIV
jgi:hypothetical protein